MTEAPALNGANKHTHQHNDAHHAAHKHKQHPQGGRLKFYKDGKFILELARAQDAWVSVPRRTVWPQTHNHSGINASERAPSLSVSDDNSSVQSSPWQRDHRWKQAAPQRGLSKESAGMYLRPADLPSAVLMTPIARRKRRRPFDVTPVTFPNGTTTTHPSNGTGDRSPESCGDEVDGAPPSDDYKSAPEKHIGKFKFFRHLSVKGRVTLKVYKKCRWVKKRRELCKIVETLAQKLPPQPTAVAAITAVTAKMPILSCKQEHAMVSPRKRILRELERVSLEDKANKRPRSRTTMTTSTAIVKPGPSQPSLENCMAVVSIPPPAHNGTQPHQNAIKRDSSASKPGSSYSINSLLSMPDENTPRRSPPDTYALKKSPHMHNFASHKTESPVSIHSPVHSPSPRSLSHAPHSFTPPSHTTFTNSPPRPLDKYYQDNYHGIEDHSQIPYPVFIPSQYFPPAAYIGTTYPPYGPRAPTSLSYSWSPYPVMPHGIWTPLPQPLLTDHLTREDASSDVPLNLSKH